ncbi:unnamed protein product [Thelazia callipaeda]|uniref:DLH domain-containing protein n=1 Tax=Thelazia callipaeda TaxID=103827 RepID=A0A0N5CTY3_THECL|nr:unnamed protein product [Thelazia callipaeda]
MRFTVIFAAVAGVVIAHDWNGRDEFEDSIAEKVAKLGYIAFAYDIYGNV